MKPSVGEHIVVVGSSVLVTMAVLAVTGGSVIAAYITPMACLGFWLERMRRRESRS
jgi:hypothetical protein